MGLISVGDPMVIYSPDTNILLGCNYVIVATSTEEIVKLYYSSSDPKSKIKTLLEESNVKEFIALAILNKIGYADKTESPSRLAKKLPGVDLIAINPETKDKETLWAIVIDLNDTYKWTRERIAEWIENTFDTKDIAFNYEEVNLEAGTLEESTKVVTIKRIL